MVHTSVPAGHEKGRATLRGGRKVEGVIDRGGYGHCNCQSGTSIGFHLR